MKIAKLFAFGAILSVGLVACSEGSPDINPATAGTRAAMTEAVADVDIVENDIVEGATDIVESAMKLQMVRKWVSDTKFLTLAIEGTYTANLGAGEVAGTWALDENDNTLTLKSEQVSEGKGAGHETILAIENIADDALTVKDEAGTVINFTAE